MTLEELTKKAHESVNALLNKLEESEDHDKNDPHFLALVKAENVLRQMILESGQKAGQS